MVNTTRVQAGQPGNLNEKKLRSVLKRLQNKSKLAKIVDDAWRYAFRPRRNR